MLLVCISFFHQHLYVYFMYLLTRIEHLRHFHVSFKWQTKCLQYDSFFICYAKATKEKHMFFIRSKEEKTFFIIFFSYLCLFFNVRAKNTKLIIAIWTHEWQTMFEILKFMQTMEKVVISFTRSRHITAYITFHLFAKSFQSKHVENFQDKTRYTFDYIVDFQNKKKIHCKNAWHETCVLKGWFSFLYILVMFIDLRGVFNGSLKSRFGFSRFPPFIISSKFNQIPLKNQS